MTNEEFQNIMIQQFNKVFEKLDTMETRLTSLEKGQLRLETRMENEIIEKIRGLSDGFEFRCDQEPPVVDLTSS